jgi:imidazole glycerol-phosphate synthase subunit HisH
MLYHSGPKTMIGLLKMPIGNLQSAWNALYENGHNPVWVDDQAGTDDLTHLIVPGVGHFRAVMRNLEQRGLAQKVRTFAATGRPVLGICVGMQLLATLGTEGEETKGLGLVPGRVDRLPEDNGLRLPHVGWNTVDVKRAHPILDGIKPGRDFYFVHSYGFQTERQEDCIGTASYGRDFAAIVGRDNVVGVQFHPEKSQVNGIRLIENFCAWDGHP